MILYILFLTVLCLFVAIMKYKDSYSWLFVLRLMLVNLMLLFTTFLNVKMSNYYAVFDWEAKIYRWLSDIKMNYYAIFDVFIILLACYMITSVWTLLRQSKRPAYQLVTATAVFFLPIAFFAYVNLSSTLLKVYYSLNISPRPFDLWMLNYSKSFNTAAILFYLSIPYMLFAVRFFKTKIKYKRKYLGIMSACLLVTDIIFSVVLFGYLPYNIVLAYSPDFLRGPSALLTLTPGNTATTALIAGVCTLFCYFILKSKMFDNVGFKNTYKTRRAKNMTIRFDDTRAVFHTCKNTLLAIEFVRKRIEKKNPPPDIAEDIEEIHQLLNGALERLTYTLNIYNRPTEIVDDVELLECIKKAAATAKIDPKIELEIHSKVNSVTIVADTMLLEEVFVNLLKNSEDALNEKNPSFKKIDINIIVEGEWAVAYIRDNGCGISGISKRRVFNPLYSTKKTAQNWGMGLSYASEVVFALGGNIAVESMKGKYTEFEIMLPLKITE